MSGISDSEVISALRRQMTIAAAKQVAAAGNLANLDTPNYKAVEVTFADVLSRSVSTPAVTHPKHLGGGSDAGIRTQEIKDAVARRDGNTVALDQELLKMSRAGGEFSAAQTALSAKFRLIRYALSEAR